MIIQSDTTNYRNDLKKYLFSLCLLECDRKCNLLKADLTCIHFHIRKVTIALHVQSSSDELTDD